MINYNKVLSNLEELKLDKIRTFLPNYLNSIKDKDISIVDILYELTEKEVEFKNQRASRIQVVVSAFPFEKEVRDFDFLYQPSVNKSQILDLESLRFLENKENIVFVGTSGVGKTHLAVALGMAAAKKRYSVYFIPCHDLILNLKKAYNENRLEARLKHYAKYQLLVIDEIGYLPLDRTGANLLFQLITKRYEVNSTIITTNQVFSKWGDMFSDNTLAAAILDRLLHHSHIIKITGPSYRLKGKIEEFEEKISSIK
ncbi:IS21-like element helper ATPase IstB [Candidatus Cetobacterium colombiensis]|uniref:IS21-like element helper ATPase IstB n=1 Tax=Candidatus Cetobacterium colombiensis TaxID=3073100 RepID=A0ABU4WG92_9FUSO|nr:IS21-like element helper ATPase IstB [Candidatus Cetobacterium colombiensis]MDX8337493.1 IS21-like element helper ATPase IstB [Candidatus Cetobacterium colombiensis]